MNSLILTIALSFLCVFPARAQDQSDDVFAKHKWTLPKRPFNCEMNLQHLEDLKVMVVNQPSRDGMLIMLARLGSGERRRDLNRRSLDNVRRALTNTLGIAERQIIVGKASAFVATVGLNSIWRGKWSGCYQFPEIPQSSNVISDPRRSVNPNVRRPQEVSMVWKYAMLISSAGCVGTGGRH
jgi:hypothetical protein